MKKQEFAERMMLIFEDRNLKEPSNIWLEALYSKVKDIEDDLMNQGFNEILFIPQKQWSKDYGFCGKPAISDFIGLFDNSKKIKTIDEIAKIEVEKIMYEARYAFTDWNPDNKTTIAVINSFRNGLRTIHFEVFDIHNSGLKNLSFFKKDLLEKWLNFAEIKNQPTSENISLDTNPLTFLSTLN